MRITVRFSARALAGANAGVDLDASAIRYREALIAAIEADFVDASVEVMRDDATTLAIVIEGADERRAFVERSVTDLAWVVKQCAPWSVAGG